MRPALAYTGQRHLAEASPHDKMWGIGLCACDQHVSSPDTWCGLDLMGQALEHTLEILHQEATAPLCYPILPDIPVSMDPTSDTVFEVNPVTHIRFGTAPNPAYATWPRSRISPIWFPTIMPQRYVWPTHNALMPRMPKQGPDLISDVVTIDDATFATLLSLISGVSELSRFDCRALLDTRLHQSFIDQRAFNQMVPLVPTTPRSWSVTLAPDSYSTPTDRP